MENRLKKNGFLFLKFNNQTQKFIKNINTLINAYEIKSKINLETINEERLYKHLLILQKKINDKFNPSFFFHLNKDLFKKLFNCKKFSVQSYFYLRLVQPKKKNSRFKPISLHRETFQGPSFFKNIFNLWIPIKNSRKINAIKYIPKSHLFKKNQDFKFKVKKTNVKKGSIQNKLGLLYKDRDIKFTQKVIPKRLYKQNHIIIFSGELIHGAGDNYGNKSRISIDLRFMKKDHMKKNPIQGATKKKYFQIINL